MRRRLVASTALIALAAVLVLGVPLGIIGGARVRADERGRLEREADGVAAAVDHELQRGRRPRAGALAALLPAGHAATVTVPGLRMQVGRAPGDALRARSGATQGPRVTVAGPESAVAGEQRALWLGVGGLATLGVAAAVALAALQARRFAAPLDRLTATSARLGAGDFSARAGRFDLPELARVGAALDASAAQIAQLVLRQSEFAANVSHQLRSPLTALRLRLEEIAAIEHPAAMRAEASSALAVADRLEATVADLLAHARAGGPGDRRELDLAAIAREHADAWRPLFARHGRALVVRGAPVLPAQAALGGLAQALDVLLDNALRHGRGTTAIDVAVAAGRPALTVGDEGPGIPDAAAEAIFTPAVSSAGSTGLGLPLARALMEAGGGQLRLVAPRPARFEIVTPAPAGAS